MTGVDAGLRAPAFFTTRGDGVSTGAFESLNLASHVGDDAAAVAINRGRVAETIGAPVVYMQPTHGSRAVEVTSADEEPEADVLVTRNPALALAALAADCVPILVHERHSGAVAAIHAGRRGLAHGVVAAGIACLVGVARESHPQLEAAVGPAICGQCYEVAESVRAEVAAVVPAAAAQTRVGTPALDLPAGVMAELRAHGVQRIVDRTACTVENAEYFSYRRDTTTGRFGGIIRAVA